jgi:hypothetical protein
MIVVGFTEAAGADAGDEVEDAGTFVAATADKKPSKPGCCFPQPHPDPHPSPTYIQFTIPSGRT